MKNVLKDSQKVVNLQSVFIASTLVFFTLICFKIMEIVNFDKYVLNKLYFFYLILAGFFILIASYFLSYFGLLNSALEKRSYRFTTSFLSFFATLFLTTQGIYEIVHHKFLNNTLLYFLISLVFFWLLNQILHSNYFSKFLNYTILFCAIFVLFLNNFFAPNNSQIYKTIREIAADIRFLNVFSLVLLILCGHIAIKYMVLFFNKWHLNFSHNPEK